MFVLTLFVLSFAIRTLKSQNHILQVKFDDFNKVHGWWSYHKDGTASKDQQSIINGTGYLKISLKNPQATMECNVGISEAQNIYDKSIKRLSVETRLKLLTPMKPGSRGWGLWKSRKNAKTHSLAWFMEQLAPNNSRLSWHLAGTVVGAKRQIMNWLPDLKEWHVYRIERDLIQKNTYFWIDDSLVLRTNGLVPSGRLSFHLWIDNQIYSKQGVLKSSWQGENTLIVDYVKITSRPILKPKTRQINYPAVLFYRQWNDVFTGSGLFSVVNIPFVTKGSTVYVLLNARLESYDGYDDDDALFFFLDDDPEPVKIITAKKQGNNQTQSYLISLKSLPGRHVLRVKARTSPVLYDLLLLDGLKGRMLFQKQNETLKSPDLEYEVDIPNRNHILFYCSASVDEASEFDHLKKTSEIEHQDQDLNITLQTDGKQILKTMQFCGNQAFGECQTEIFVFKPTTKKLNLRIEAQNQPVINKLFIFQLD